MESCSYIQSNDIVYEETVKYRLDRTCLLNLRYKKIDIDEVSQQQSLYSDTEKTPSISPPEYRDQRSCHGLISFVSYLWFDNND